MKDEAARELKQIKERKEIAELLHSVIIELNRECERGALLVVEGRRDQLALQSLGLRATCFWLSNKGFSNFLNSAESSKKVILLLDYDRKGRYMFARATRILQSKRIPTDGYYRKAIKKVTKGEIVHIEQMLMYSAFLA
ncbi:MAG: toprim domain-containing protein [Conexivisphaerales archaeon]